MQLSEPMPRLLHVPKGATCNFPNRCPDHYTFPSGRHATLRTDAQITTRSQAGDMQLSEPMPRLLHVPKGATCNFPNRCPDYYTFPRGRHATFRTDAQITTRSQAGDMQLSEPMPRSLHVPKRATCNFPNRCPDHYTFPSGRHATLRTKCADQAVYTLFFSRTGVGLVKGRLLAGELSLCPPPILLLPLLVGVLSSPHRALCARRFPPSLPGLPTCRPRLLRPLRGFRLHFVQPRRCPPTSNHPRRPHLPLPRRLFCTSPAYHFAPPLRPTISRHLSGLPFRAHRTLRPSPHHAPSSEH